MKDIEMRKKFIIVNGTMGVGKTTVCNELHRQLKPSAFLDGDWCWQMNPFIVNDETKTMVEDNITHILTNYLQCSAYEYVIFCWVLHQEFMIEKLLRKLDALDFEVFLYTLICSEDALCERLKVDIQSGIRSEDVIERSVQRLKMYGEMKTMKVDVSNIDQYEAARVIINGIGD